MTPEVILNHSWIYEFWWLYSWLHWYYGFFLMSFVNMWVFNVLLIMNFTWSGQNLSTIGNDDIFSSSRTLCWVDDFSSGLLLDEAFPESREVLDQANGESSEAGVKEPWWQEISFQQKSDRKKRWDDKIWRNQDFQKSIMKKSWKIHVFI